MMNKVLDPEEEVALNEFSKLEQKLAQKPESRYFNKCLPSGRLVLSFFLQHGQIHVSLK